ncbi:MAG: hypothetical protein Q4C70_05435 [Planctomycetia bacterium]|nr:hypothetical protein [Planctomycetia bacterium]
MAEVVPSGKTFIIRVSIQGKRVKIYTGIRNRRVAERMANRVESLKVAMLTTGLTSDLILWAQDLAKEYPKIFDRLRVLGLLEGMKERKDLTLGECLEKFFAERKDTLDDCSGPLKSAWEYTLKTVGEDRLVTSLTADDVTAIIQEILAHRIHGTNCGYKESTRNGIISRLGSIGRFLEEKDYVIKSPLCRIHATIHIDRGNDRYVPVDFVIKLLEIPSELTDKICVALGRFAGFRGMSEIRNLGWEHITWSADTQTGTMRVKAPKTHSYAALPLSPALETLLLEYWKRREEPTEGRIIPYYGHSWHLRCTRRVYELAGITEEPPRIWYNLRRSYCCDVMEHCGGDPVVYEALARHNFATGMKFYQMLHGGRKVKVQGVFLNPDSPLSRNFGDE